MADNEILMNPDGLVVNAYRDAPGRGDYFNGSSGTSEGQFLFIIGMLDAYVATGDERALAMAERALNATLYTLYRNTPIPAQVTEQKIFAPHWLFAVKYPFKSSLVNYDLVVNFTNGVGVIPNNDVRYVWYARSLDSTLLWTNPYSPLTSGTRYEVASYTPVAGGMQVTLQTAYNGQLRVVHSEQNGPVIEVNEPYEAWPDWRKLDSTEIEAACDVFIWAYRAFQKGYEVTGNQTWADAARATREQAAIAIDLNDGRDWLKPTWTDSPFADGKCFSYVDRSPPPGFGVDSYGRVQIDIPQYLSGSGEVQYGRASIGDTYADGDTTTITLGSNKPVTVTIYIDQYQAYADANRYSAQVALAGTGDQTVTLNRTSFKNNVGATLPADSPVYTVGVSSSNHDPHTLWITRIRQSPPRDIAYYPGAIPFTANFAGNPPMLIDWRGPIYAGYQAPQMWTIVGNPGAALTCVYLLTDAQNAWVAQTGKMRGPFAPVYYFDRDDAIQYGTPGTFGWNGPDPNTKWGGYQYRPLAEVAESFYGATLGTTYSNACLNLVTDFLQYLSADRNWIPYSPPMVTGLTSIVRKSALLMYDTDEQAAADVDALPYHQDGPPTDYPQTGSEVNYNEPHMVALILRAFIFRDTKLRPNGGSWDSWEHDLFTKCYGLLKTMYVETGVMAGTFSNDPANREWYGFWHGEILSTLTQLLTWSRKTGTKYANVEADARKWLKGMTVWAEANSPTGDSPWGAAMWPFSPNWANGINEAFEFSTNIITSFDGSEQRIARRPKHRRSLTLRHTLTTGDQSAFYGAILRARQNRPMLVPQWHMARKLAAAASVGQEYLDLSSAPPDDWGSGTALVLAQGPTTREINYVTTVEGNRVNLRQPLSINLSTQGLAMAAYMGLLNKELSSSKPTTTYLVAETNFLMLPQEDGRKIPARGYPGIFEYGIAMNTLAALYVRRAAALDVRMPLEWPERNVFSTPVPEFTTDGDTREVVTRKPNWISDVSVVDSWVYEVVDYFNGPVTPATGENIGRRTMQARWTLMNDVDCIDFLTMLGRLKGTRKACWLPSWSRDFELTRDPVVANQLYVRSNGIISEGILNDAAIGICVITKGGGFLCARVSSFTTGTTESLLTLDRNLDFLPKRSKVARVCLLYRVRQASDKSDITWLAPDKAEVQVSFITVQE